MLPRSNGRFLCLRHTGSRTGATLLEKTRSLDAQARHSAWKRRQIAYASGSENARNQQAPESGNARGAKLCFATLFHDPAASDRYSHDNSGTFYHVEH